MTGATGTSNAVNVAFRVLGNIIVINVSNAGNVQSPGRNVRRNQDVQTSFFKLLQNVHATLLRQVAMNTGSVVSSGFQSLGKLIDATLRSTKNNRQFRSLYVQNTRHDIEFFIFACFDEILIDQIGRKLFCFDLDNLRFMHEFFADCADCLWHRCGKKQRLSFFRNVFDNCFNIFQKAHVEHFVGFIQNKRLNMRQIDSLTINVVKQSPRRSDQNLRNVL